MLQKYSVLYLLCDRKITWPGPQSFPPRRGERLGAEGSASPNPLPTRLPSLGALAPCHPHAAPAPEGTPRPGAGGAPASLGAEEKMRSKDPAAVEQSTSTGWGSPGRTPPLPSALTHPWERSRGGEQEGDTYILSDDCESEPEAGLAAPAPAAPRGNAGLQGQHWQKRKAEAGPLKRNIQENHATNPLPFIQGHKHQRAGRQPVFRGSTEQILGAGPTRCPLAQRHEHSTVPAAPGPGARDQAPACHDWAWGIH